MKTATVRDLRNNFSRVSRWLAAGEEVAITKRGVAVGTIQPALREKAEPRPKNKLANMSPKERREMFRKRFGTEHTAWMKRVYGNRKFTDSIVLQMREEKDW